MLYIEQINVFYGGIHAIKDVSLEVYEGETVALLGVNASGKSTCLKTICGCLRPTSGDIIFQGRKLIYQNPREIADCGITCVPEGRHMFSNMTLEENLELGFFHEGDESKIVKAKEKIFELLPDLDGLRRQRVGALSVGEQQMLAMGQALMSEPKLLLLDEPSLGLTSHMAKQIFGTIKKMQKMGLTILFADQNTNMALNYSDRAYILEKGYIVLEGPSSQLSDHPELKKYCFVD